MPVWDVLGKRTEDVPVVSPDESVPLALQRFLTAHSLEERALLRLPRRASGLFVAALFRPTARCPSGPLVAAAFRADSLRASGLLAAWAFLTPSLRQADALADRLRSLPEVAQAITASSFVPTEQEPKLAILGDLQLLLG